MTAPVTSSGTAFEAGAPQALFPTRLSGSGIISFNPNFAVSRDGRFLINERLEESGNSLLTLILNWHPQTH
jgi:hypothetical protein